MSKFELPAHPATAQLIPFPCRPAASCPRISSAESARIDRSAEYLTTTDHAVLAAWIDDPSHGYGRLHLERVLGNTVRASFALIYVPGVDWSAWGLARRDGVIEIWRCSTGKTFGRHQAMSAALASLPHASEYRRTAQPGPPRARRTASFPQYLQQP